MFEEYYLDPASVPEIFKIADQEMEKYYKKEKIVTKPREIPMPRIEGRYGANGPVFITEDWYLEMKRKQQTEQARDRRDMEVRMMKLLANKERLRFKLGELDPSKKQDSKKIVAINVKLKDIAAELQMLEMQSGIHLDELDSGSKLGRFSGMLKQKWKKLRKKIKKFYRRHEYVLNTVASIILPIFGGFMIKSLMPT